MDKKEEILVEACGQVQKVVLHLEKASQDTEKSLRRSKEIFPTLSDGDKIVESGLMRYNKKRIGEIAHLVARTR